VGAVFFGNDVSNNANGTFDEFYGGKDVDFVSTDAAGPVRIYGGAGGDKLTCDGGFGWMYGGSGNDALLLHLATVASRLFGGDGTDFLFVDGTGDSVLDGGPDRDRLIGDSGNEILRGGDGDESGAEVFAGSFTGKPGLYGGAGNDLLDGGNGNDWLYGGSGANTLIGGFGNDTFFVDSAGDTIIEHAGGGSDTVEASVSLTLSADAEIEVLVPSGPAIGAIALVGSDSANVIGGTDGANLLSGRGGNDSIVAELGDDRLEGGLGDDSLFGEEGDDVLAGGAGKDTLKGDVGRDSFVFDTAPNKATNVDLVVDFSHADDTFFVDNAIFKTVGKNGKLAKDAFIAGKKALDAEDRLIYDKASGNLFYDADGTGKIAAIKIAILQNKAKIDFTDVLVI